MEQVPQGVSQTYIVVVQNVGTALALEFRIDLYVDPTHAPGINDLLRAIDVVHDLPPLQNVCCSSE